MRAPLRAGPEEFLSLKLAPSQSPIISLFPFKYSDQAPVAASTLRKL